MKIIQCAVITAIATASVTPSHANQIDPAELRAKLARLAQSIQRLKQVPRPTSPLENVSCSGAEATTVTFTTSTTQDRRLASAINVRVNGQVTVIPAFLITTYLNEDTAVAMKAFRSGDVTPSFEFRVDLVPTVAPKPDEVATYSGTVTVGANRRAVICNGFRQGAGLLKAQLGENRVPGNINVVCSRAASASSDALVQFDLARSPSQRLVSDVNEVRSTTDAESLPSFLVSQYSFSKTLLSIDIDDGSADGNKIASLEASGVRVPTNQPPADPAVYGIWAGTYQRFDVGRQIKEAVTCYAY